MAARRTGTRPDLDAGATRCYLRDMVVLLERELVREEAREAGVADERAARRDLRDQIARLEAELAAVASSAWPRVDLRPFAARRAGPRVLGLGELESIRDELAGRVSDVRVALTEAAERQERYRVTIERMLLDPAGHKWRRVTNADIGEPGCKSWHVRPRLGLIGMLAGWWHVKISSGCPRPAAARGRSHRP